MNYSYAKPPRTRDNAGRFRKYAAAYINKALQKEANELGLGVRRMVKDKLQEVYVKNVKESYTPRAIKGKAIKKYNELTGEGGHKKKLTYRHTGTFVRSIHTVIEGNIVKVKIKNEQYDQLSKRNTKQVYKWLTQGTEERSKKKKYPYSGGNGKISWALNYSTPPHKFEQHTREQMKGYLAALQSEFQNGDAVKLHQKYAKYVTKSK
jgi:hypothetical protein